MRTPVLLAALLVIALAVAACGTPATPVPNSSTLEAQAALTADAEAGIVVAATNTPIPPTETPTELPPTATPTEAPTEAPPEEEEAEAEEPADTEQQDPLVLLISRFGDPVRGQQLFNTSYDTALGEYMCATCHLVDSDDALIGPGLLNLPERAGERVEGQPAEVYVYRSIIHPNEYIVEGFAEGLMPGNYEELLNDQDLYDLSAYLLSLGD